MTKYYLTVEGPRKEPWSIPPTYGFASEKDAQKLCPGDMILDYVARNCGFMIVMKVEAWDKGLAYKDYHDNPNFCPTAHDYPFRVKIKVLCEIQDERLAPKWRQFRPYLRWCNQPWCRKDMSESGKNQTLRLPLREIDKHDFNMIAEAIYNT